MSDAFFVIEDDNRFRATDHTRGPWSPDAQHGGPPAALMGRSIELTAKSDGFQVARVTFEILKPLPVETLTIATDVVRPGRSVELIEATMSASGTEVMTARAWCIRTDEHELDTVTVMSDPPPGPPDETSPGFGVGYIRAMDIRFVKGAFDQPGPATAWFRMRHPLIEGEETLPLCRVLIAADSGNGISSSIDWAKWLFINPDLSVYLHRLPGGEWICIDAVTYPEPTGVGLASSRIYDEKGLIGAGMQSLYIGPRSQ